MWSRAWTACRSVPQLPRAMYHRAGLPATHTRHTRHLNSTHQFPHAQLSSLPHSALPIPTHGAVGPEHGHTDRGHSSTRAPSRWETGGAHPHTPHEGSASASETPTPTPIPAEKPPHVAVPFTRRVLPEAAWPYADLMRLDKPIGSWLLYVVVCMRSLDLPAMVNVVCMCACVRVLVCVWVTRGSSILRTSPPSTTPTTTPTTPTAMLTTGTPLASSPTQSWCTP